MRSFGNFLAVAVLMVLVGTALSLTSLAAAQREGSAADRRRPIREETHVSRQDARKLFERMCDFLELDESQRAQARQLFEARGKQVKSVREKVRAGELDRRQARALFKTERDKFRQDLTGMLTAAQIEKLASWEKQRKLRQGKGKGRTGAAMRQLGLSDSQQEQLAQLRKRHQENLRGIRDKAKSEELEREQARTLLDAERDRFRQDLAGVLTAAQMEQLKTLMSDMAGPGGKGKRGGGKPGPMGQLMHQIRGQLQLSDAQLEQLRELAAPYRKQIRESLGLAREQKLEREQVHLLIKPLVDGFVGELAGILDSGQQDKLNEFLGQLEERHRRRVAGESAGTLSESTAANAELAAGVELPKGFSLAQNSPNPFNPSTTISYSVPEGGGAMPVRLTIYDMRGREIIRLVEAFSAGGSYSVTWDGLDGNGRGVSSGVYLYRLQAGEHEQSRKMVMLK